MPRVHCPACGRYARHYASGGYGCEACPESPYPIHPEEVST